MTGNHGAVADGGCGASDREPSSFYRPAANLPGVQNVTDRTSNPFGMQPPCEDACVPGGPSAVFGYGDANADFHVIGDCPAVHGGATTGVPFTESVAGERLQAAFHEVGLLADAYSDEPEPSNLFCSYLYMCCLPEGELPDADDHADLEPFFDAELRAIAAHVLVPVGETATRHVLKNYTAQAAKLSDEMEDLHAREVRGSGFLVVPVRDPVEWEEGDGDRLVARLRAMLDSDYRQTTDLSRFLATDDLYMVR